MEKFLNYKWFYEKLIKNKFLNVNCYNNDNCSLRSSTLNSVSFTKDSSFGAVWSADW